MSGIDDIEKPVHPPAGPPAEGVSASPQDLAAGGAGGSGPAASGPPPPDAPATPGARPESAGASAPGAPSQQELAIRSALETVMDPEIGLSVIDLDLIREAVFSPEEAEVKMVLTTPFCPYGPMLINQIQSVSEQAAEMPVKVTVLPDKWEAPPWLR